MATFGGPAMTDEPPSRRLRVRAIRDVEIVQTRYVWNDYLPVGEVSLLVGKPGLGKSTVVVDLAAKLTTGQLDGAFKDEPHHVLYSTTEDSPSTLKARFVAAGGDPDYLHLVDIVYGESVDGTPLIVNLDLDAAREAIAAWQPVLLVLDALNSSLSGQLNDNSVVRPQLEKLKLLAHHTGAAILGVGHFRKATAGVDPVDAIGGAGAYTQVVRHVLACGADEDNFVLSVIKSNIVSVPTIPSLAYGTEAVSVSADDGGEATVGRIHWLGESATSVADLLQHPAHDDGDDRADAVAWLSEYLVDCGGEAAVADVLSNGDQAGFSKDTLKRAKSKAKVRSQKASFGGGWVWRIRLEGGAEEREGCGAESAASFDPLVRASEAEYGNQPRSAS